MFGIGFNELALIALVALIVLGPEKLPGVARTAGVMARRARLAWNDLQSEIQGDIDLQAIKREFSGTIDTVREAAKSLENETKNLHDQLGEVAQDVQGTASEIETSVAQTIGQLRSAATQLDEQAGGERDDLRVAAADLRATAERIAKAEEQRRLAVSESDVNAAMSPTTTEALPSAAAASPDPDLNSKHDPGA